jgi:metallo-beta-lactamase class B
VSDVRFLLITHAHFDHAGGLAELKAQSGAEVAVMAGDAELVASGGKADPISGALPSWRFPPAEADRILNDGDVLSLGGVTLTARLGAGHTRGATTWIAEVEEGGRSYRVVFPCCTGLNSGVVISGPNAADPEMAGNYRRTFQMLESLTPDIVLPAHTETFDFEQHRRRAARMGVSGWLDRGGYQAWIAAGKARFEEVVEAEAASR